MLRLDLSLLDREGSVDVQAAVPPDDALWKGVDVTFEEPVDVDLRASSTGSGEVVVRGTVSGRMARECRRCLKPVSDALDQDITMVFAASDSPGAEDDGDVRLFDADAAELDLSEAVREEVVLAIDPYVVCDPECRGLCPSCGVNLNEESCGCVRDEADPRWEALRALKEE